MNTAGARLFDLLSKHPNYGPRGQSRLSRESGVPQSTISRFIKDENVPEMETIAKIAVVFGVTCEWLITGRGPKYVTETYAPALSSSHPLSAPARMLIESIVTEDQKGLRSDAFSALNESLRIFSALHRAPDPNEPLDGGGRRQQAE
ncbi:helix-turn-helix domain-containing protein [Burkholderia gladioli]|uniref:helix-turn-helix domain-containing protein n=1 Tax=Burkholderia gladioli TaxID=28095 RepID=UPI00163F9E8C|nr:helix-turn-helix transcriptional regulator [Burkholderia gladioli]